MSCLIIHVCISSHLRIMILYSFLQDKLVRFDNLYITGVLAEHARLKYLDNHWFTMYKEKITPARMLLNSNTHSICGLSDNMKDYYRLWRWYTDLLSHGLMYYAACITACSIVTLMAICCLVFKIQRKLMPK